MPKDFIIYRKYYEDKGYTQEWRTAYRSLSEDDKKLLIDILSEDLTEYDHSTFDGILQYYVGKYRYSHLQEKETE